MKKLRSLVLATAASAGLLGSVGTMAATDGKLDPLKSEGKFDINLNVPSNIGIWGLRDLPFTSSQGSSIQETINACVYSDTGRAQFQLSTTNEDFQLKDGNQSDKVGAGYTVSVKDKSNNETLWGSGGLNNNQLSPVNYIVGTGTKPQTDQSGNITQVCALNGGFQTIDVVVDISAVTTESGTYTDEVTLIVTAI